MASTYELRSKADALGKAIFALRKAKTLRDSAKHTLDETESSIFYRKQLDGTIDGKNADTRDAQARIQYKIDDNWQVAWDTFVAAEIAYQDAQATYDWCKIDLQVQAIIVNTEIAESGATRLLAEVELAAI